MPVAEHQCVPDCDLSAWWSEKQIPSLSSGRTQTRLYMIFSCYCLDSKNATRSFGSQVFFTWCRHILCEINS